MCSNTGRGGVFLGQGRYEITGKPLVFFILQPQSKENADYKGEFGIYDWDEKEGYKYCITGNERKIKKNMTETGDIIGEFTERKGELLINETPSPTDGIWRR